LKVEFVDAANPLGATNYALYFECSFDFVE